MATKTAKSKKYREHAGIENRIYSEEMETLFQEWVKYFHETSHYASSQQAEEVGSEALSEALAQNVQD